MRGALVLFVALAMLPLLSPERGEALAATMAPLTLVGSVVGEVMIGSVIGLASQFVFGGMQLAGQLGGGQALLVGDSAVDLSTARAAAMPFALATWGFGGDALAPDLRHPDESLLPEPARLAALLGL